MNIVNLYQVKFVTVPVESDSLLLLYLVRSLNFDF